MDLETIDAFLSFFFGGVWGWVGISSDDQLHLSLSRPVSIKSMERESFRTLLSQALTTDLHLSSPISFHFARVCGLINDDGRRGFLGFEVGHGHSSVGLIYLTSLTTDSHLYFTFWLSQLVHLVSIIDRVLGSVYLEGYYPQPIFHASFAWTLLENQETREGLESEDRWRLGSEMEKRVMRSDELENLNSNPILKSLRDYQWKIDQVDLLIGKKVTAISLMKKS